MKSFASVIVLLVLAAAAAAGQTAPPSDAKIYGTVFDPNRAVIVGAELSFTNTETKARFSAKTGNEGGFSVTVPPGSYEIKVSAPNFVRHVQVVELAAGRSLQLDFRLSVSSSYDPIDVVHEGAIVTSSPDIPEIPTPTPGISVIKFAAPAYPPIAKTARIQGDVRLLIEIASDGSAKNVSVLSGHPMLVQAAEDAVKQWRFGCQRCDQPLRHIVTVSFVMDEKLSATCQGNDFGTRQSIEPALPNRVVLRTGSPCVIADYQTLEKIESRGFLDTIPIGIPSHPMSARQR
jgi:TonB family protein